MTAPIAERRSVTRADWLVPLGASAVAVVIPLLVHARAIFRTSGPLPFVGLDDDAFYYLTIARNIAAGLGSTFDGIGATNGFHPIWLAILVSLAAIAPGDDWLVASVYWLNSLLWMGAIALMTAIGRQLQLGRHVLFALPILVWYGATWGGRGHHLFFTGLEIGLTVMLLLAVAWAILRVDLYGPAPSRRAATGIGVLLGLLILSRLDAVFIAAALVAAMPFASARTREARARWSPVLPLALPVGIALLLYAMLNLAMFGTPLAVSGQAKSIGAPWFSFGNLRNILLHGFFMKAPIFAGALLVPLSVFAVWALPGEGVRDRSWRTIVLALAAGFLLQALAWWASYAPGYLRGYYFYVTPVLASLALPRLLRRVEERIGFAGPLPSAAAAAGALLLAWAVLWPQEWRRAGAAPPQAYLEHTRQTSAWLRERLPPGTRYAMADRSGIMGFLLKRPVFQLEGLVNTPAYLRDLAAGRIDNGYLLDLGIEVYILSELGERPQDGHGCIIAPAREGGPILPRLRLCPEDLLWRAEFSDGAVSAWRLKR